MNLYKICLLTVAAVAATTTKQELSNDKPSQSSDASPTPDNLPDISLLLGFTLEFAYLFSTGNDIMAGDEDEDKYIPIPLDMMMWSDNAVKNYNAYQQILSDVSERLNNKTHFFSPLHIPAEDEIKSITWPIPSEDDVREGMNRLFKHLENQESEYRGKCSCAP